MLYQILIYTHIICGTLVLLLGLYVMLRRKGTQHHKRVGWVYVLMMWMICLSAFLLVAFHRFSFFLMVIGVLTFYSSFVGIRVVRRNKQGHERWFDWLVSGLTLTFGLGLIGYAIHVTILAQGFHVLAMLSLIFGLATANAARQDIQFFRQRMRERHWWLYQHVSAIGGSYIAAVTALAVQNGNIFLDDSSLQWLPWVLPGVLGGMVISRVNKGLRKQHAPD